MKRFVFIFLSILAVNNLFAEKIIRLKSWGLKFDSRESEIPPPGAWKPCEVPGDFDLFAQESEGYIWLHKKVELKSNPKALILGPLGLSERVYLNRNLIGGTGTSGKAFIAPIGLYRGYVIPQNKSAQTGEEDLYVRLYHRTHSWIEEGIWLVPLKSLNAWLLLMNFTSLFLGTFLVLFMIFLFIQSLYYYFLEKNLYFLYLGFLAITVGISGFTASFFIFFLPFTTVLRIFPIFEVLMGLVLILFTAEYLQTGRLKLLLVSISPLFLVGIAGFFMAKFINLIFLRYFQIGAVGACLILGTGLTWVRIKKMLSRTIPLGILYVLVIAAVIYQLIRPGFFSRLFRPNLIVEIILLVFASWIIHMEIYKRNKLYISTTGELVERVEADWELIEKLKGGKENLEKRNLESITLSGRLMESAQKQALAIGQIMSSIAEGASAENKVMLKEKEILNLTIEVDSRISDFNQQIQKALNELEELHSKSKIITGAVGQIIGISDKTNMLSLNASIEASKAGEAGRGFAVVAHQIRKLADICRNVSDQINALIRESNKAIEKNVKMVQGLEHGYEEIMKQSEEIRQMIEQNSRALEEVTKAHLEIQDGIAGVDRTIKTILEVSRDCKKITGSLADAFSWFHRDLNGEPSVITPEEPSVSLPEPLEKEDLLEKPETGHETGAELEELEEADFQQAEDTEEL